MSSETKENIRHQRANTAFAALATLLSLAALALSLITYFDQKENEAEASRKAAGQIDWSVRYKDGSLDAIIVENRTFNTAYDVMLLFQEPNTGNNLPSFAFQMLPPCSRETYTLGKRHGREVDQAFAKNDYFLVHKSALGEWWSNNGDGSVTKIPPFNQFPEDLITKWKIPFEDESLDACG